jgi:hypothetical protein
MMMVAADYKRHRNGIIAQDTGWLAQAPSKRGSCLSGKELGRNTVDVVRMIEERKGSV